MVGTIGGITMQTIELQAIYSSQKSFYKKAHVRITETARELISYTTKVATICDGKVVVHGTYSVTTLIHIKEFLKQNGFEATSKAQIIRDYCEVSK